MNCPMPAGLKPTSIVFDDRVGSRVDHRHVAVLAIRHEEPSAVRTHGEPERVVPTSIVLVTALVAVSTTETLLGPLLATWSRAPEGSMASPSGMLPTGTVAMTPSRPVVDDRKRSALLLLLTYTRRPFGLTATWLGSLPTGIVAMTLLLVVSITETLLLPLLTT